MEMMDREASLRTSMRIVVHPAALCPGPAVAVSEVRSGPEETLS
ncbi:hypothetical protein N9L68_07035 [bacterium]|nr:hypothetical protein [bacterium]